MFFCFLLIPVFIVLGILFGLLSPLITIRAALKEQHHQRFFKYLTKGSRMSEEHNRRVKTMAAYMMTTSPLRCIDETGAKRTEVLFRFYKQSHTVGVLFQFLVVSMLKIVLLVPVWGAIFGTPWDFMFGADNDEIYYIDPTKSSSKAYAHLKDDNENSYKPPETQDSALIDINNELSHAAQQYPSNGLIDDDNPFDAPRMQSDSLMEYGNPRANQPPRNDLGLNLDQDGSLAVPPEMEPFGDTLNTKGEGKGLVG